MVLPDDASTTSAASQAKDLEANMPRLLSKIHTGNESVFERYPLRRLPDRLALVGRILNQFDQTLFNVIWFTTNFSFLTRCVLSSDASVGRDFVSFYPYGGISDGGSSPLSEDKEELDRSFATLKAVFGDSTDLVPDELAQIMIFDANRVQLRLFCQAFAAVWLRDYGETIEISPDDLLQCLRLLFEHEERDRDDDDDEDKLESAYKYVRHVLVTFTHMASKDYERITRSG